MKHSHSLEKLGVRQSTRTTDVNIMRTLNEQSYLSSNNHTDELSNELPRKLNGYGEDHNRYNETQQQKNSLKSLFQSSDEDDYHYRYY